MRDKIIGFIISVVCFIISLGFVKGQAMALPFVPTDWTWDMYQGLHMLGDLIANDVNFEVPDWVDFNDFDDVKLFLENIYNEGKKKVAYASIISDFCVGTWNNFLDTGEVSLPFSESTIKRTHNTGFFQHIVDYVDSFNPGSDVPTPSTPAELVPYVNMINLRDSSTPASFHFFNATGSGGDTFALVGSPADYTWLSAGITSYSGNVYEFKSDNYNTPYMIPVSIKDLYVTSAQSEYYINQSFPSEYLKVMTWGNAYSSIASYTTSYNGLIGSGRSDRPTVTLNYHGTLTEVFDYISKRVKNVNIWVDDTLVASVGSDAGTSIDNPLGVVIPQNVIDEVENGKISGLVIDATLPDTDNLVGSIDLGVVMDELREAQANGRTATLDGVRTKDGVRALDGTVVGTVSKAVAIDVPSTASLVTAADEWGYIPYYPEIPSAFSGTTILSELIDATQTIVPNDLIMAIWGLVIILFIIALINIFHK